MASCPGTRGAIPIPGLDPTVTSPSCAVPLTESSTSSRFPPGTARRRRCMSAPTRTITLTVRMTVWHYAQTADAEVKIEFIVNSPYVFDRLQCGRYTSHGKRTERLEEIDLKLAKELFAALTAVFGTCRPRSPGEVCSPGQSDARPQGTQDGKQHAPRLAFTLGLKPSARNSRTRKLLRSRRKTGTPRIRLQVQRFLECRRPRRLRVMTTLT